MEVRRRTPSSLQRKFRFVPLEEEFLDSLTDTLLQMYQQQGIPLKADDVDLIDECVEDQTQKYVERLQKTENVYQRNLSSHVQAFLERLISPRRREPLGEAVILVDGENLRYHLSALMNDLMQWNSTETPWDLGPVDPPEMVSCFRQNRLLEIALEDVFYPPEPGHQVTWEDVNFWDSPLSDITLQKFLTRVSSFYPQIQFLWVKKSHRSTSFEIRTLQKNLQEISLGKKYSTSLYKEMDDLLLFHLLQRLRKSEIPTFLWSCDQYRWTSFLRNLQELFDKAHTLVSLAVSRQTESPWKAILSGFAYSYTKVRDYVPIECLRS